MSDALAITIGLLSVCGVCGVWWVCLAIKARVKHLETRINRAAGEGNMGRDK